jgi:hypothetical protein
VRERERTWPVPQKAPQQPCHTLTCTVPQVTTADGQHSKLVVRGDERAAYHRDVIHHAERELAPRGLTVAERGGGFVRAQVTDGTVASRDERGFG